MVKEIFLDKAYDLEGEHATRELYNQWSTSYDAEISENGYATPARIADALARVIGDQTAPILDYGCGTGLSGMALRGVGFTTVDGADPSPDMLKGAEVKGAYRKLTLLDIEAAPPFVQGEYPAIAAIGVIGTGAAPVSLLDTLMGLLSKGSFLAFSFNDHALEAPEFPAKVAALKESGQARILIKEYGDHLPGINLSSMIYVLEKT